MYYWLRDHIYIAQFKSEIILLDTKRDTYTVCSESESKLLEDLLSTKISAKSTSHNLLGMQKLIDGDIIEKVSTQYPFYIDRKASSNGVSNIDWALPLNDAAIFKTSSVFSAFMTLLFVNFSMKIKGFYGTIQLIKKARIAQLEYIIPTDKELIDLAHIVNKACAFYPTRVKCLEWAMTYVLLALKKQWKCNLEIGIQNYPFSAHAWVECNEKVVMDTQELREGLAIILNEPFKKFKT